MNTNLPLSLDQVIVVCWGVYKCEILLIMLKHNTDLKVQTQSKRNQRAHHHRPQLGQQIIFPNGQ